MQFSSNREQSPQEVYKNVTGSCFALIYMICETQTTTALSTLRQSTFNACRPNMLVSRIMRGCSWTGEMLAQLSSGMLTQGTAWRLCSTHTAGRPLKLPLRREDLCTSCRPRAHLACSSLDHQVYIYIYGSKDAAPMLKCMHNVSTYSALNNCPVYVCVVKPRYHCFACAKTIGQQQSYDCGCSAQRTALAIQQRCPGRRLQAGTLGTLANLNRNRWWGRFCRAS